MTSTTSCFLPAASRAGNNDYSSQAAASLGADEDDGATRSFEELCPRETPRDNDTPAPDVAAREPSEQSCAEPDTADAGEAECNHDEDTEKEHGEQDSAQIIIPLPLPQAAATIQSLLAGLGGTAPQVVPQTSSANPTGPAEPTASGPDVLEHPGAIATETRPAGDPTVATATAMVRGRRAREGTSHEVAQRPSHKAERPGGPAMPNPGAAGTPATPAANAGLEPAKPNTAPGEENRVHPAVTRLIAAKTQGEKSAGSSGVVQVAQIAAGQNNPVLVGEQNLVNQGRTAGTRSAIPASTMSSSTANPMQRHADSSVSPTAGQLATGQGAWTETLSVDWKGWTNGGGERASTAAQFSQLGEKLSQVGAATPAPTPAGRPSAPAAVSAPPAPAVPVETAEALAPIHSAIERLVLHGREQLALTVRFEQGGSLSIKLGMNHGEIATQIQTDVPGLEAALKSAWGELAQDWNGRGWKLGSPEFTSTTATYHQNGDNSADGRGSGREARQRSDDMPDFGGRAFAPARLKHPGPVTVSGHDAIRAAAIARRGIHTWA